MTKDAPKDHFDSTHTPTSSTSFTRTRLEGEAGEEPTRLASLEPLLQNLLGLLTRGNLLRRVLQRVGGDGSLEVHVEGVAGGHEVVVVDRLDEGLDARVLVLLLLIHLLGHLARVGRETAHESVTVGAGGGASLLEFIAAHIGTKAASS